MFHLSTPALSRRALLGGTLAAATTSVVGCSSSEDTGFGDNTSLNIPTHIDPPKVDGAIVSDVPGVPPGYTTLKHPLPKVTEGVPGRGGAFTTFQVNWGAPPQSLAKNKYWQEVNERLGVEYQPTLVPADAYETKLATMLSSGKVADMVFLHTDSANAQQAIQDGAFAELSGILGGDKIKKYPNLAHPEQFQWEASAVNNGIYGIPGDLAYVNSLHVYRQDWAKKLGFSAAPANADEFLELMSAMSKGKPAGSRRTYGFGGYSGGVSAFINAMFRVPNNWGEDGGQLTNMIETDEYEEALTYTAKLWKAGAFHPDALSLAEQGTKDRALFDAGTTGWQVASGDNWYLAGALRNVTRKDPGAKPELLQPFGHDGKEYAWPLSPGFYAVIAISAEAADDEERLDEILRVMNYLRAPIASEEGFFLRYGTAGVEFEFDDHGNPVSTTGSNAAADRDALFYTGLVPVAFYYPQEEDVRNTVAYTEDLTQSGVKDPTVGLFADSSADTAAKLDELRTDYVNGLVSGRRPLTDLEKFREDWRKQGGDQLRNEFEEAIQTSS